jgi:ribosome biogenesis SPOUT family RNA methylase Rps3
MSSDTAILVTSLIINDKMRFDEIPLIHDPEFTNP